MSRIGIMPVAIPQGVKVSVQGAQISVEGPKGKLTQNYASDIEIKVADGAVSVSRKNETKQAKAYHGLYRSLINNMVTGVSKGFTRTLVINGVGYKAELRDQLLVLSLGFSSDFIVAVPKGLTVEVEKDRVRVSGADLWLVGKFASEVRGLRAPEPYKGKGIRYEEEVIRKKVGKTGVK